MKKYKYSLLISLALSAALMACSRANKQAQDTLNIDIGAEASTLDPALIEDINSERVAYDLYSTLATVDQTGKIIPGLAESWDIAGNNKEYIFHLRPNAKFSDGTPITADDVVFSWQRIADPKIGSPYSMYMKKLANGNEIVAGKLPVDKLGIVALDSHTVKVSLVSPEPSLISVSTLINSGIVSKKAVLKYGKDWTNPQNIVTSGAYIAKEWVVHGYILAQKNPNYYDAAAVTIPKVKYYPIVDANSSLNQYKTGDIDITWSIPVDQFNAVKTQFGDQMHINLAEAMIYLDLNMTLPKYAKDRNLRQALSMAIDRQSLVNEVLAQGQKPLYSIVTPTIENGNYSGVNYPWFDMRHSDQIVSAQVLFSQSGYSAKKPLQINLSYGTSEINKKVVLAVAAMWKSAFGNAVNIVTTPYDWKSFLANRKTANYDIERTGWIPSYNYVDNYMVLYTCGSPQNTSRYCNPQFDSKLADAKNAPAAERVNIIRAALQNIQNDYFIVPLFQNTSIHLVNPRVKGYDAEHHNHLGLEQSKWYHF